MAASNTSYLSYNHEEHVLEITETANKYVSQHRSDDEIITKALTTATAIDIDMDEYDDNKYDDYNRYDNKSGRSKSSKFKSSKEMATKGIAPIFRISGLVDFGTDIYLLLKIQSDPNLLYVTVIMLLSVISPFLLCYSSGIRLYLNQGTFDRFSEQGKCTQFLVLLYLLPFGVLYYIFLDFYLVLTDILIVWPYYFYSVCKSNCNFEQNLAPIKSKVAKYIGMSLMNLDGHKRMRTIAQLSLENMSQLAIQLLFVFNVISLSGTNVTTIDLAISLTSTITNFVFQYSRMHLESLAVKETYIQYALSCMIGRIGWIPFINQIKYPSSNTESDIIHYNKIKNTKCKLTTTISYYFSEVTIRKLIDSLVDIEEHNTYNIRLQFGSSCDYVNIQQMIQFLYSSQNKIQIVDLCDINWDKCCQNSIENNQKDIRIITNAIASSGEPLLKLVYKYHESIVNDALEVDDKHLIIFKKLLENGININATDPFNETVPHYLIRNSNNSGGGLYIRALRMIFDDKKLLKTLDLNIISHISQNTAAMDAIQQFVANNGSDQVWALISDNLDILTNFDVNSRNKRGQTMLQLCFRKAQTNEKDTKTKLLNVINELTIKYKDSINKHEYIKSVVQYAWRWIVAAKQGNAMHFVDEYLDKLDIKLDDIATYDQQNNNILHIVIEICRSNDISIRFLDFLEELLQIVKDPWTRNSSDETFIHTLFRKHNKAMKLWYRKAGTNRDEMLCLARKNTTCQLLNGAKNKWFDQACKHMFVEWFCSTFDEEIWKIENNSYANWQDPVNAYWIFKDCDEVIRDKDGKSIIHRLVTAAHNESVGKNKQFKLLFVGFLLKRANIPNEDNEEHKNEYNCAELMENFDIYDAAHRGQTFEKKQDINEQKEYESKSVNKQMSVDDNEYEAWEEKLYLPEQCMDINEYRMMPLLDSGINSNPNNRRLDVKSRQYLANYNDNECNALLNPFVHLTIKRKGAQSTFKTMIFFRVVSIFVELLAAADFITDIIILTKFIQHRHVWWTSTTILMLLSPYFIAVSSLLFLLKLERDFFASGGWGKTLFGAVYLSPFGVLYFLLIDFFFIITTIFKEVIAILTFDKARKCVDLISVEMLLSKLNLSTMDVKGFRRLRTISQIAFESLPQIILQTRILFTNDRQTLGITATEITTSILLAAVHVLLEGIVLYYEAKSCKMNLFHYGVLCLNGRAAFVPFIHLFTRDRMDLDTGDEEDRLFDFNLNCRALCDTVPFNMDYEFSKGTFNKLLTSLTYLTSHEDLNKNDCIKMIVHAENVNKIDILDISDLFTVAQDKILLTLQDTNIEFFNNVIKLYKNKQKSDKSSKTITFHDKYGESLLYRFIVYNEADAVITLINNDVNIFEVPLTDKYTTIIQKALQLQQGDSFRVLIEKALSLERKLGNILEIFSSVWAGHCRLQFRQQNVSGKVEYYAQESIQIFHALMLNKIYCNYQSSEWFVRPDGKQTVFRKIMEILDSDSDEERDVGVPTCLKQHPAPWTAQEQLLQSHAGYRFGFNCNDCRQSNNEGRGAYHCKECLFDLCDACVAIFLIKLQEKKDIENKNELKWCENMLYLTGFYQFDLDSEIKKYENETNQSKPNTKRAMQAMYNELEATLLGKAFGIKMRNDSAEYINVGYAELDKFLLFREYLRLYSYHNLRIDDNKLIPISLELYDTSKPVFIDLINTFKFGEIYVKRRKNGCDLIKMDELLHKLCVTYDIGKYIQATKYLRQTVTHKYKYETPIKLHGKKQDHSYGESLRCGLPPDLLGVCHIKLKSLCRDQEVGSTEGCFIGVQIIRNGVLMRELNLIVINHFEHSGNFEWANQVLSAKNDWELNCIAPNDIVKVRCFCPVEGDAWTLYAEWIEFELEYVLSKYKTE